MPPLSPRGAGAFAASPAQPCCPRGTPPKRWVLRQLGGEAGQWEAFRKGHGGKSGWMAKKSHLLW